MAIVPDAVVEWIAPPVQPPLMADGTANVTMAPPGNDPVALDPLIADCAKVPRGHQRPCHLMRAVSWALVCDDAPHANGLDDNVPVSLPEKMVRTYPLCQVQLVSEPATCETRVPPPDALSEGANVTVAENEQDAVPGMTAMPDAEVDVATRPRPTVVRATSPRATQLRVSKTRRIAIPAWHTPRCVRGTSLERESHPGPEFSLQGDEGCPEHHVPACPGR